MKANIVRVIGLTLVLLVGGMTQAALACPIPCVWVENDDPYVYAEVCSPVR